MCGMDNRHLGPFSLALTAHTRPNYYHLFIFKTLFFTRQLGEASKAGTWHSPTYYPPSAPQALAEE